MYYPTKNINKLFLVFCFFILFSKGKAYAQIVIGKPNLGFSPACASSTFNDYSTTFIFSPESGLNISNQFTIELSDADGDFSSPTPIFSTDAGTVTTSPATLSFSFPQDIAGENYRIRIKSSAPVATSTASDPFAAYYKIQDSPFTINNLVSSAAYCTNGSYLLTIDNPGSETNDSPLNYPSLTYQWYKETGPTTSDPLVGETGSTLNVTEEGTYFVETYYGSCTSDSFSNRVTIIEATMGEADAGISSSLGNPFCPDQGATTLSTIGGNSYQWFKDGVSIPDATNQMYQATESGTYAVQVNLGTCSASGAIVLVSELFDGSLNVSEINTIEDGESLSVIVSTTANNPVYEWYLDNLLISGAAEDNFIASSFGNYSVIVTETSECTGSREFLFEINEAFDPFPEVEKIPNVISPNGDSINDTWVIPTKYVTGTNTEVMIMDNRGKVLLQTNDYLNNWPEVALNISSVNQVFYYVITAGNETKKGSITIIK